ncbi:class I SAM-dependent methyltransferase [Kribbella sp. NPDC048915]|uniref:class I SAM-dependent methyltransferase n=1 Tax=Kribbella sp. NPDC048915 TaxID=3155148 RepID=UPI0033FF5D09
MTVTALLDGPGAEVLAAACAGYRPHQELQLVQKLRRQYDATLVTTAVTQAALRHRAVAKFGADAERMYFTPDGLEQATRTTVSTHRAARIAATRIRTVVDLGCGIGGDLITMARAGLQVTGIERDPETAAVARANLAAFELPGEVLVGDAEATDLTPYDLVFADPARRADGRRVFDHNAYSPPWSFVTSLLERTACVKVAPGIPHAAIPDGVEAEWISDSGEVKEAALWSGELYGGTPRRATLLPSGATVSDAPDADVRPIGQYIYEPDGAVVRAGLVTAVAAAVNGWLLDSRIAYLSAAKYVPTPLASAYEVLEELPYKEKALRAWVRAHGLGTLEIKKRGVDLDPAQLRKKLAPKGSGSATLIITRIDRDAVAYACRRVTPGSAPERPV